jgi:glycosyltransferase involved in cell wall biosynthesis
MWPAWREPLFILCGFSAFVSIVIAIQFRAVLRRVSWSPVRTGDPVPKGRLSVIIPARNEAEDLGAALRSVLDQAAVGMEVLVVDDHSTDQTGAIANSIARDDPRVKVIHNPDLPAGWLGKANAMQQAAALASGDYLLFTDADVRHDPRCFATALTELERAGLDFLSLFPEMQCVSFWENVILPALVGGLVQLATPRIEDQRSPDALAAGAFLLVRSDAFRAIGGFEAIRDEMLDDVALARLLKQNGYRVGFRAAPQLSQVRLFKGNRHAFWGLTKNILAGFGNRIWVTPIAMFLPVLVFWVPILSALVGLAERDVLLTTLGALTYGIQYAIIWLGRSLFRFHAGKALGFPLVAIVVVCCTIRAIYYYTARGAVQWRGRTIRVRTEGPRLPAASEPEGREPIRSATHRE